MNRFLPEEIAALEKGIAWLEANPACWSRLASAIINPESAACCVLYAAMRHGGIGNCVYTSAADSDAAQERRYAVIDANDSAKDLPSAIAAVRRLIETGVP